MPAACHVFRDQQTAPRVADALLQAGILEDGPWNGSLDETIRAGLSRWLESLGADQLKYLDLDLTVTDNIGSLYLEPCWGEWANGCEEKEIGAFAVTVNHFNVVVLGRRVQELERAVPGAGYSVFRLLTWMVEVFEITSPAWMLESVTNAWDCGAYGDEEEREDGEDETSFRHPETFEAAFPRELFSFQFDRRKVERAAKHSLLNGAARQAAQAALVLADLLQIERRHPERECHLGEFDPCDAMRCPPPIVLRWSTDDPMEWAWDDYVQWTTSGWNDVGYLRAWSLDNPDPERTPYGAAKAIKQVVPIIVAFDRLLQHMHSTGSLLEVLVGSEPQQLRQRVRVRA